MAEPVLQQRAFADACTALVERLATMPVRLQAALERHERGAFEELTLRFEEARDTLRALGLPALSLLAGDAARLVDARRRQALVAHPGIGPGDVASALLAVQAHLVESLERRAQTGDRGATRTLAGGGVLSLINRVRSLLGDGFVTAALLLALDIPIVARDERVGTAGEGGGTSSDASRFAEAVKAVRPRVMRALIDWFRAVNAGESEIAASAVARLAGEFDRLLDASGAETLSTVQADLLFTASALARAIAESRCSDDGAVRRLFAQIERWLVDGWIDARADPATSSDPVAARSDASSLLRNLLFYLATASHGDATDRRVRDLERRYALDRIRSLVSSTASPLSERPGERPDERPDERLGELPGGRSVSDALEPRTVAGRRLRREVVARLREELVVLIDWLGQGGRRPSDRGVADRLKCLSDMVAVLELLGALSARDRLQNVLALFARADGDELSNETRIALAEAMVRLETALDGVERSAAPADGSRAARSGVTDAIAARVWRLGVAETDDAGAGQAHRSAVDALTDEALRRLRRIETDLEALLGGEGSAPATDLAAQGLRAIAAALDLVPRPEVSALLSRLADIVCAWSPSAGGAAREPLARLAVAIEVCLQHGGQASPVASSSAADALDDADAALAALEASLPARALGELAQRQAGRPADAPDRSGGTATAPQPHARRGAVDAPRLTERALDALGAIGDSLARESPSGSELAERFGALRQLARESAHPDLERLATAASRRALREPLDASDIEMLQDAHFALPQLIEGLEDGEHHALRRPQRFDALLHALGESAGDSGRHAENRSVDASGSDEDPLDGTLREVFLHECDGLLDTLDAALAPAMASGDEADERAPISDALLRALHTLIGSARTADADAIAALALPMQTHAQACRARADAFPPESLPAMAAAVSALRQRREAFATGQPAPPLPTGLLDALQAVPERAKQAAPRASLDEIFVDEAHELIDRLERAAADAEDDAKHDDAARRALTALHTLKGSARVAGWRRLGELAHGAEDEIERAPDARARRAAIVSARRALSAALAVPSGDAGAGLGDRSAATPAADLPATGTMRPPTGAPTGSTRVRDSDWQRLSGLSHDIAASQARLALEFSRLESAGLELERTAQRWRRLPAASNLLETEAARELLHDLSSVRRELREALRAVDLEQRRGARAGIALQQDLLRARLQRFDVARHRLERTVEDASVATGTPAALRIVGGSTTLDVALHAALLPLIEHLLRNAVAHGIEPRTVRLARAKSPVGEITVECGSEAGRLRVTVRDDGGGVDDSLVSREPDGHDRPALDALLERLLVPGATSRSDAGPVAGRGMGLVAVKDGLQAVGGALRLLHSDASGTAFELRVAQRLPVQSVLLVEDGGLLALPVEAVAAVEGAESGRATRWLSELLGEPPRTPAAGGPAPWQPNGQPNGQQGGPAAIGDQPCRIALANATPIEAVDVRRVLGYRELVVRPLDAQLASLGRYDGVAALPDGRRVFLVDPALLRVPPTSARARHGDDGHAASPADRLALVADDSPTQRAWTRDALEALGFAVRIAQDGREALDALAECTPEVLLLDIDMPRVDGYGVLKALTDAERRPFPIIVLSSRSSARDRDAASAFGASGFIAKPATREALRGCLLAAGVTLARPE